MRRVRLILLAVGSFVAWQPVYAQWQLSGDAGVSHLRQSGLNESNALSLATTFDATSARTFFQSSVLASRADGGAWTGQGVAYGALLDPSRRPIRWQLTGALSGFSQDSARPTTSAELGGSLQAGSPLLGGAIGVGTGASLHARDVTPVRRLLANGWQMVGADRFDVNVSLTRTRLQLIDEPSLPLMYVDASASWRRELAGMSIGASGGYRSVIDGPVESGVWGGGDVTFWFASRAALALSVGTSLADVVRGVPRTTYATAAMRFAARPHLSMFRHAAVGPRLRVRRDAEGMLAFEIHAPDALDATDIELAADFTGWKPVRFTHSAELWRLIREVPPGGHRVMIRIDGGRWIVPPNLPRVDDDFGGSAGMITIP